MNLVINLELKMRQIKFRAKNKEGNWVYGSFVKNRHGSHIYDYDVIHWEIDPQTIGEYVGLKDQTGCEIYEGDIVKFNYDCTECANPSYTKNMVREVKFLNSSFCPIYQYECKNIEVIGNIHENSELIKEKNE